MANLHFGDWLSVRNKSNVGLSSTATKGHHLWEFIRDTINDRRYNPECIKWENKEQGIFRIVNSAEIAKMWGRTKNNSTMTYEKFSRAMR